MPEEIVEVETTEEITGALPEKQPLTGDPSEDLQATLDETRAALKRANAESAQRRKRLAALEKAETERAAARLSETEKAQKEAEEWEGKYNALHTELHAAQVRAAFYDEADAQKLLFVNAQAK